MERRRGDELKGTYDQIPARSSGLGEEDMDLDGEKSERGRTESAHWDLGNCHRAQPPGDRCGEI